MSDVARPSNELVSDLRILAGNFGEVTAGYIRDAANEIERLQEELEQANDIRSDREIIIELMRGALGVSIEPHQTLSERLVEAAGKANTDWACPHYKPRGKGCTECSAPEPPVKPAAWQRVVDSPYEPGPRMQFSDSKNRPMGDGWEPLYLRSAQPPLMSREAGNAED